MPITDDSSAEHRPRAEDGKSSEDDIPILEDVVYPGTTSTPSPTAPPEPEPQIPSRAEIDSWLELALEARLEPLRKQLRRELWEELLKRFPALRERDN